jgi:release factor glutamine methyltransferase
VLFGHLPIAFDDQVLRPRQWTTAQSIWAAELLREAPRPVRVLELCAGAGQIGLLALALSAPVAHSLVAVDVNPAACEFARRNAAAVGLHEQVEVREGPLDEVLDESERFALVIADPPWVEHDRIVEFPEDPESAIDGGADGLDLALRCIDVAETHLIEGGSMLLQLGPRNQLDRVGEYVERSANWLTVIDDRLEPGRGALLHLRKAAPGRA